MYVIFVTLFNFFDKHREKYSKLDFIKFIWLEINYFVGTDCFFIFKKYRHTFLSGNKSKFPFPFLSPLFFYTFLLPSLDLTVTAR